LPSINLRSTWLRSTTSRGLSLRCLIHGLRCLILRSLRWLRRPLLLILRRLGTERGTRREQQGFRQHRRHYPCRGPRSSCRTWYAS
jgi:hypothetical protein